MVSPKLLEECGTALKLRSASQGGGIQPPRHGAANMPTSMCAYTQQQFITAAHAAHPLFCKPPPCCAAVLSSPLAIPTSCPKHTPPSHKSFRGPCPQVWQAAGPCMPTVDARLGGSRPAPLGVLACAAPQSST